MIVCEMQNKTVIYIPKLDDWPIFVLIQYPLLF